MKKFFLFLLVCMALFPWRSSALVLLNDPKELQCVTQEGFYRLQVPILGCTPGDNVCCSSDGQYTIGLKGIPSIISTYVRFGVIAVIVAMILLLMLAGVQYVTSFGDPKKAAAATQRAWHAAMGLVLVMFSTVILYQVNPALISLEITQEITEVANVICCKMNKPSSTPTGGPYKMSDGSIVTYSGIHKTVLTGNTQSCKQEVFDQSGKSVSSVSYTANCPFVSTFANAKPYAGPTGAGYYLASNINEEGQYVCNEGDVKEEDMNLCLGTQEAEEDVLAPPASDEELVQITGTNIQIAAGVDARTKKANLQLLQQVAAKLQTQGITMLITSAYRSPEKQQELIKKNCPPNATKSSDCTPATALKTSAHNTGSAIDAWGARSGVQCIRQAQCSNNKSKDACRKDPCQRAMIQAMVDVGFCNLSIEAWHFENPQVSSSCIRTNLFSSDDQTRISLYDQHAE